MEYSVGVKNKFELFSEVDDPDFIHISAKKQIPKHDTKKPLQKSNVIVPDKVVTVQSKSVAKPVAQSQKTVETKRSNDKTDRRSNEKGGRADKRDFGNKGDRKTGKREFDRRSGSDKAGVKPTEKREGFGKNNWGNYADDEKAQNETTEQNNTNDEQAINNANEEIENVEPVEEEPKVLTLEEYRKQEQEKRLVPKYNIRKPGEGDTQQWKKGYVLKKDKEEEEEVVVYEEIEVEEKQHGKHKKVLDIDITFREDRKNTFGGGFRGDRGNFRFNRDRGDRPPRGDREERSDRPPRRDREDRPPREDRGDRSDRPPRRDDRGPREDRPPREDGDRQDRRERNRNEDGEEREERRERRERRHDGDGDNREDRSGRRDDRGPRRSGGNFRSKGGKPAAPKFDDLNDFPTLGLGA